MISAQRALRLHHRGELLGAVADRSAPSFSSRSRTTPALMVSIVALRIFSAISFGVPFGTAKPYQAVAS